MGATAKYKPKRKFFNCDFQGFWPYFRRGVCCQAAIFVKHLWVAVSVFGVPCELKSQEIKMEQFLFSVYEFVILH